LLARSLERVDQIGRELDDPLIAALSRSIVGLYEIFSGRMREGVATLEKVQPLLAQKRDFVGSSFALVALAFGYSRLGDFTKAEEAVRSSRALAGLTRPSKSRCPTRTAAGGCSRSTGRA